MGIIKSHFGYDVSDNVTDYTVNDRDYLLDLVKKYKVLRWTNQHLTPQQYIDFSEIFNECWTNDDTSLLAGNGELLSSVTGYNKITRVSNKNNGVLGDYEVSWHSDIVHKPHHTIGGTTPCRLLYSVILPNDEQTITSWSDCEYGYHNTPDDLKLLGEKLIMCVEAPYKTTWNSNFIKFLTVNPYNNKKSFKYERTFFKNFVGMNEYDSKELMDKYLGYCLISENIITHNWNVGDILFTNNYNTIHQREKFVSTQERTLWRTTFQVPELTPTNLSVSNSS